MTDRLEDQLRSLAAHQPPTSTASPDTIVASLHRRRARRRQLLAASVTGGVAALTCGALLSAGAFTSSNHRPGSRPSSHNLALGPGCLPPNVTLATTSTTTRSTSGLPTILAAAGRNVTIAPTETSSSSSSSAITNLKIIIGAVGATPEVDSSGLPIPLRQVLAQVAATPDSASALLAPSASGQYPIIASYDYLNDPTACPGSPRGDGQVAAIIGYVTVS